MNTSSTQPSNHSSPTPTPTTIKKRRRPLLIGLSTLAILAILTIAFLPSILGSKWIYQKLVDQLKVEGFQLQIDNAKLAWLQPIAINGINLEQLNAPNDRRNLLSIDSIASNRSLLGYLLNGRNLGKITIKNPKLAVELLEDSSNLEKLTRSLENSAILPPKNSNKKAPPNVDVQISVESLSVDVRRSDSPENLLVIPPVHLNVHYKSLDGNPRIHVEPTTLLDQVTLTQELVRLGLGRAIPLLANSAWFDGQVSLHIDTLEIPLDNPTLSKGKAELTLHQVRSGPSEPIILNILDMIAKFRKKEPSYELVFIDGSVIQVQLANGQVEHRGVQVGLPKIDQRLQLSSAGTVGLVDKTLNIGLGIPVPIEMLARRESVQQIGIPQITLPIRGTADSPFVDWKALRGDSADLLTLISAALGDEAPATAAIMDAASSLTEGKADQAIGAAIDVLKELRQRRLDRKKQQSQPTSNKSSLNPPKPNSPFESDPILKTIDEKSTPSKQDTNKSEQPRRPLRDALKNILNGNSPTTAQPQ
jgi:hypothetical protein